MTLQTLEKLTYNGRTVGMASEPLSSFLENLNEKRPLFPVSSGCWRGYVGTWLIEDDKLYLIGFQGYARIKPNIIEPVDLSYIFPGKTKVFASWFTGELRIPDGEVLQNIVADYYPIYEIDKFLEFKQGRLIGKRMVDNLLNHNREFL